MNAISLMKQRMHSHDLMFHAHWHKWMAMVRRGDQSFRQIKCFREVVKVITRQSRGTDESDLASMTTLSHVSLATGLSWTLTSNIFFLLSFILRKTLRCYRQKVLMNFNAVSEYNCFQDELSGNW